MPTLIQNYQKKVTIERLKHFSSMIQQANQMRKSKEMTEEVESLDKIEALNPDSIMEYFNIYLKPYLQVSEAKKTEKGIIATLANGSAMYMQKYRDCPATPTALTCATHIIFCPQAKHCDTLDESKSTTDHMVDGKLTHLFWVTGTPDLQYKEKGYGRDSIIQKANTIKTYCTTLIYYDGWEISDDNPCWK